MLRGACCPSPPQVHLKRFSFTRTWRDKLDTPVDFPVVGLDMAPFLVGPRHNAVYDLYAVANHYGGLGGGHYTAHAKHSGSGQWYLFDDSHVSPAREEDLKGRSAYMLFYRRRETAEEGAAAVPGDCPA